MSDHEVRDFRKDVSYAEFISILSSRLEMSASDVLSPAAMLGRVDAIKQERDYYRWALEEVDRRIHESTQPLVDLVNRAFKEMPLTDDEKRAIREAWQWGVYSTAIHAQIALTYRAESLSPEQRDYIGIEEIGKNPDP